MPIWLIPFIALLAFTSLWNIALAVLAFVDAARFTDDAWRRAGHRKSAWMLTVVFLPFPTALIYWSEVRPDLDRSLPAGERRAVPLLARHARWEQRLANWDQRMRRAPWFRWAVACMVLAYALTISAFAML